MATEQRQSAPDLTRLLERQFPGRDDFFQLIRVAERLHNRAARDGKTVRVGTDGPPAAEALRFEAATSTAFAPGAVKHIQDNQDMAAPAHVSVNLLGITGPSGALPHHYTTLVQQRLRRKDHALADFLNIFNHRLISLLYRAWAKHKPAINEEYHDTASPSAYTRTVQTLAARPPGDRVQSSLYYGGHFSRRNRSAASLRQILQDFLRHPVAVEPFVGQWLQIPRSQRFRLGQPSVARGERLGDGVLIGHRVWDAQSRIRIDIGPLSSAEHETLLPSEPRYRALCRLLRAYLPAHLTVELRYAIRDEHGADGRRRLGDNARLGWTTWARSGADGLRHARYLLPAGMPAGGSDTRNKED